MGACSSCSFVGRRCCLRLGCAILVLVFVVLIVVHCVMPVGSRPVWLHDERGRLEAAGDSQGLCISLGTSTRRRRTNLVLDRSGAPRREQLLHVLLMVMFMLQLLLLLQE